ncbi:hypothetical protein [Chryseobacterium lactis]|uniref:hypothetical protein n=1 Tax=Chryseobacterium lactis TaxID=1241981 RepID=UPI001626E143|nr:hypothetical protein [Chryseobacterium lactis]
MKKLIIPLGILLTTGTLSAQSGQPTNDAGKNVPAIFPPTPESYKLGTYGNIPVGLFTGSPNMDIPITSLASGNINLPILLNYSSNGIKVDDTNGSVGIGWRFISGGVITRVIRDIADETSSLGNLETPDIPVLGMNNQTVKDYLELCKQDNFDSEQDLFMANFNGRSLKFIINRNGSIVQLEKSGCRIEKSGGGFKVTTEDGSEYLFGVTERTKHFMTNTGAHHGGVDINATAWYLSKIKSPENREVNIEYDDVNFTSTVGRSQSMYFTRKDIQQFKYGSPSSNGTSSGCNISCNLQGYSLTPTIGLISDSRQTVWGKQIKKISDQNGNYILFEYQQQTEDFNRLKNIKKYATSRVLENFDLEYSTTTNGRVFLSGLKESLSNRKYSFDYYEKDEFPGKLSLSRDMWGYYNGLKNNTSLIPQIYQYNDPNKVEYDGANQEVSILDGKKGLLKTVTYPTGGFTNIEYENHKSQQLVTVPPQTANAWEEAFNDHLTPLSSKTITITPNMTGDVYIALGNSVYGEGVGCNSTIIDSGKQRSNVRITDASGSNMAIYARDPITGGYYYYGSGSYTVNSDSGARLKVLGVKGQPITFKLSAQFFCSLASLGVEYYISEASQQYKDIFLGGYRVASMTDTAEGSPAIKTTYQYVKEDGTYSIGEYSKPYFMENRVNTSVCEGSLCSTPIDYSHIVLTSTNLNQYNSLNPNIFYSRVVENKGQAGKIIHEFSTMRDDTGSTKGDEISGSPLSNTGWNNGKELMTTYLDSSNKIVKKITRQYLEDITPINTILSLATRKKYELMNGYDNLDFVLYKNISRFPYLKSQETADYLNGVAIKTSTEFFYENPLHYQLTRQITKAADNSIQTMTYSYAHEKGNPLLIGKNMVSIPLETQVQQTVNNSTKMLSREETLYPTALPHAITGNLALPIAEYSFDNLSSNISYKDLSYDKYDEKGNILQYTTKDGTPVSIVWGYYKTKPIAKVVGAAYSQIENLTADIVIKSNEDATDPTKEAELLLALDNFRPQGLITTYTYDPLVGITTITQPSGIRELYIYDNANRLKEIRARERDSSGNYAFKTIKEFKYNYKP